MISMNIQISKNVANNKGTLEGRAKATDFTGQVIDDYIVLYPMKQRAKNRSVLWRVQCMYCKHERILRSDQLSSHRMPKCACERLRLEAQKNAMDETDNVMTKEELA